MNAIAPNVKTQCDLCGAKPASHRAERNGGTHVGYFCPECLESYLELLELTGGRTTVVGKAVR